MKVVVVHAARDLRVETREMPKPGPGQVLVKLAAGGICGSDLHYVNHGGFGTVRLREPMILGHEVAGHIESVGAGVADLMPGTLVAVSPSRPCGSCSFCNEGRQNHCLNMRFYGSAMPFPHIQGAFREYIVADAAQCADAGALTPGEAAMAEPLAVVLHAARQVGDLMGRRVLVTGCGPIGLLAVLVARAAGAVEIVATDISDFTLAKAREVGADATVNVAREDQSLDRFSAGKGYFDTLFECSGVASALAAAVPVLRPGATIAQLGLGGDMTLPLQAMTAKELQLKGSFRFHAEFFTGVEMMRRGRLNTAPLITHRYSIDEAQAAFAMASDRTQAIKVNLTL
ncbi:L-idonate 5-dehydrogenase [Sulfitobacter albidus]|uniref:L-idonate 5-dehydrogenase n=1 Tax=Sulfitobacter albidus TaxID=2829501 RepID=A0A975PP40_9RHOB|nr:L-idonate 5-dehydrogenase [Sulfitobacter albidus]QUJ78141.1 L-idonate 5-dehydrogenase [Sulfitobacter albidus]